jgi:uncharacterized protein YrzB (UPF0473 family)
MEKKINNILFVNTNDGKRLTFNVLFTHHSDIFNKDYVVFYDTEDENHLLAFSYDENITFSEIENQNEIDEVYEVLKKFDEEQTLKDQGE